MDITNIVFSDILNHFNFSYIFSGYKDYITLLNSAIFSPVFYSWLLKPILDKLGVGYKHIDKL